MSDTPHRPSKRFYTGRDWPSEIQECLDGGPKMKITKKKEECGNLVSLKGTLRSEIKMKRSLQNLHGPLGEV